MNSSEIKIKLLIILISLILLTPVIFFYFPRFHTPQTFLHSSHLFEPFFYDQAVDKSFNFKIPSRTKISGGIIPHHLLASPLIAGFFEGIKEQKFKTVILFSPDHYDAGKSSITMSIGYWETAFGRISPDSEKIRRISKESNFLPNENLFENEHGIYGIVPFIKKYFPEAKIIPVVIKGNTNKEECDKLVSSFKKIFDHDTLVLVSADFSHYQTSIQADNYDRQTIEAIENFNEDQVLKLDNTKNIDSPQAIYLLLKLMKEIGASNALLISNTNSAKLTNQSSLTSTTSYATFYFQKEKNKIFSMDTVFNYRKPEITGSPDKTYTIIATGDVIPARSVNAKTTGLMDFNYPYAKTFQFLKKADAVFINLESPLIPNCPVTIEGMKFCGDERNILGLVNFGVKVASVANNHMGNYGLAGIKNTSELLKKNQILVTGDGNPAILKVKDKTLGFLGYNDIGYKEEGIEWAEKEKISEDIRKLKEQVDFVIIAFHWGVEYTSSPTQRQTDLAHSAIDAGADLVIGNHPHWIQGVEKYKGKIITYAHGNFVFDQMWSRETQEGVVGKYVFDKDGLIDVSFYPVVIENYSQPRFADKDEAEKILLRMKQSSAKITAQ